MDYHLLSHPRMDMNFHYKHSLTSKEQYCLAVFAITLRTSRIRTFLYISGNI